MVRSRGWSFEPRRQAAWVGTHAALPVVHRVERRSSASTSARATPRTARTSVSSTLSLITGDRAAGVRPAPIALAGSRLGAFDDAGVTSSCVVERRRTACYLFYTGWALGVSVPFYLHAGVAVSDDGGASFRRLSAAPLLDRTADDPYLTASPWVLIEDGLWRMWYVSGTRVAQRRQPGPRHRYHIKYAESGDGLAWDRRWHRLHRLRSRRTSTRSAGPCVVNDGDGYRMWYSLPRRRAIASDTRSRRTASSGRAKTTECVLDALGRRLGFRDGDLSLVLRRAAPSGGMLYNGNGYGRTGIGLASRAV